MKTHQYQTKLIWTGNTGPGTSSYRAYQRSYTIEAPGKPLITGSSDPAFRGDPSRYNPEEMLVASLSSCHMLWYLHLCASEGIIVVDYQDEASGTMEEQKDGGGRFVAVTLYPRVLIKQKEYLELAKSLHKQANEKCFIANSCNFPIHHHPEILVEAL